MNVFVGVDGGGTHARAVVIDEAGGERARITGGAGIVDPRDPAAAALVIAAVVRDALRAAGHDGPADAICCGLAGAGRMQQSDTVTRALFDAGIARQVLVVGDAEAAMRDAFGSDPGVLLIAGTGSIAWARNAVGDTFRVGGWGLLLGDEGSAYDVGLQGLREVARSTDGRAADTQLTSVLLAACDVGDAQALVAWTASASKAQVGALAPFVLECAERGDPAATRIRESALDSLLLLVGTAARRAGLVRCSVALAGGLIEKDRPLRAALESSLAAHHPALTILPRAVDAAHGAALIASTR